MTRLSPPAFLVALASGLAAFGCSTKPSEPPPSEPKPDGAPQQPPPAGPQWSLDELKEDRTFTGHAAPVTAVSLSTRGHRAASCGNDKTVRVWDVQSGKQLQKIDVPEGVQKAAISP